MSNDNSMSSPADMECNSFFDHIDDLLDVPEDNNKTPRDVTAFSGLWSASPPHSLLNFDSVIGTGCSADLTYEDIVQMEWLSMFMEDSFGADNTMTLDIRDFPATDDGVRVAAEAVTSLQFRSSSPISVLESSSSTGSSNSSSTDGEKIQTLSPEKSSLKGGRGRARSKRARPTTFTLGSATELLVQQPKTGRCKSSGELEPGVRKCLHCGISKTPQWRSGPLGPKTLCNACGVRYKSGRLFPEYRPAASPTFVPSIHSNSHKKVLEMRTNVTRLDG